MLRTGRGWIALVGMAAVAALLAGGSAPAQEAAEEEPQDWEEHPYIQQDGAFDYGVFNGHRRYHAHCHVCHGPDALGSSFAPALTESLKTLSYAEFLEIVVNGRQTGTAGQENVMPSFGEVPDVMLYIDHLYAYLKARADGELGRGRPQRLPPEEDPVFQEFQAQQG